MKQTQTEWLRQAEKNVEQWKRDQAWLNQFTESAQNQNEPREAQTKASNPWKKTLPSTFYWSPEIAQTYKKTEGWKEVQSIANHQFQAAIKGQKHDEWKPPTGAETYEKNEAAIATSFYGLWPFVDLPQKVSSLASYCRQRKQKGLPLTATQERFFAQLVNVYREPELPECHEQFLEGPKQGATIRSVLF